MEELQRRSQTEDVPVELIQRIQSLLPVKEAAHTCVLSKNWSHAWSTIPNLRFNVTSKFPNEEKERDYINFMDRTISKYAQHNIPIESFKLKLDNKLASHLANKWIPTVAAQSCLKELSICICYSYDSKIILPDEIFSGKNLHTLSLRDSRFSPIETVSRNPVIKCVNLRVLKLEFVKISEAVLDTLFSTCILLEKIHLSVDFGLKTFKVRNLRYLQELKLMISRPFDVLKIDDVPDLQLFFYYVVREPIKSFNLASLTSVTELSLHGVIIDFAFLDMIESKLPSLEILCLLIRNWTLERLNFTSSSLKRLTLTIRVRKKIVIQVNAPKLHHMSYSGNTMPSLLFRSSEAHDYMKLKLHLWDPVDRSFFLKMREILNLPSKFDIEIRCISYEPAKIDNDDREIRFTVPCANVQQLSYFACLPDENLQGQLSFFDALITLCHPKYATLFSDKPIYSGEIRSPEKYFCDLFKPMISGLMENRIYDLKDIEFKNPAGNEKWEILTADYYTSTILDISNDLFYSVELKLNW